jgi:hypothetical protein
MAAIFREQLDYLRTPVEYVQRLASDPHAALVGLRHVLAIAVLYELAILLWAFGADGVTLPPFLRIPEQQYYFVELIFLIPLFILTWLLAAGIAYLLSKALGGNGSFDALLGGFGLAMAVSAYFTLIPDYLQGILWTTGWVPFAEYQEITGRGVLLLIVWVYMLAYVLSHVILYALTVRHTQGLSRSRAVVVGLMAFLGSFAVWITYAR